LSEVTHRKLSLLRRTRRSPEGAPASPGSRPFFFDVSGCPPPERPTDRYDLALSVSEEKDDLRGVFFYDAEIFDASAMERLRGHFLTLLEGIVAEPNRPVSLQPLLTPEERLRILVQ
jgi:non-ribosomal peptide synthetase component F